MEDRASHDKAASHTGLLIYRIFGSRSPWWFGHPRRLGHLLQQGASALSRQRAAWSSMTPREHRAGRQDGRTVHSSITLTTTSKTWEFMPRISAPTWTSSVHRPAMKFSPAATCSRLRPSSRTHLRRRRRAPPRHHRRRDGEFRSWPDRRRDRVRPVNAACPSTTTSRSLRTSPARPLMWTRSASTAAYLTTMHATRGVSTRDGVRQGASLEDDAEAGLTGPWSAHPITLAGSDDRHVTPTDRVVHGLQDRPRNRSTFSCPVLDTTKMESLFALLSPTGSPPSRECHLRQRRGEGLGRPGWWGEARPGQDRGGHLAGFNGDDRP